MKSKSLHIPDQELLMFVDGELAPREMASLRTHLENCPQCVGRLNRMKGRIAEITTELRESRPDMGNASGPRALLRSRLIAEQELNAIQGTPWLRAVAPTRNLALACVLLLLTVFSFHYVIREAKQGSLGQAGLLPDPNLTPGFTRQVALTDLCATVREDVVRSVPPPVEQQVFEEYGIKHLPTSEFELDYLITPGLGGTDDVRNLWPEPHANTVWNSYVKDQLEDHLHRMVCDRKIPLEQAQRDMASNWIAAYKKYFQTDRPMAGAMPRRPAEVALLH